MKPAVDVMRTSWTRSDLALIVGPAGVVLWAMLPVLGQLWIRWSNHPRYSHGHLVPLLSPALLWIRRDGRGWRTPDEPRRAFVAAPALSKLDMLREASGAGPPDGRDFSREFLDVLLPALDRSVFPQTPDALEGQTSVGPGGVVV